MQLCLQSAVLCETEFAERCALCNRVCRALCFVQLCLQNGSYTIEKWSTCSRRNISTSSRSIIIIKHSIVADHSIITILEHIVILSIVLSLIKHGIIIILGITACVVTVIFISRGAVVESRFQRLPELFIKAHKHTSQFIPS